jgi:hypothetical protein
MRPLILCALILGLAASASALTPSTSNVFQPEQKPWNDISRQDGVRVQGDTVEDPFIITGALPFTATGSTCGFVNDYDSACPYTGSTSADVVYKLVPTRDTILKIDLCASTYDTKLYFCANTIENVIACNDDHCSWQSQIGNIGVATTNTYYIVVDGYGGLCGSYTLLVEDLGACPVVCPPGAILEGEPDCYDGYSDVYNGGCDSTPFPIFQPIEPADHDITICGTTGVFAVGTQMVRDTDWFELNIEASSYICLRGSAECPCDLLLINSRGGCGSYTVVASGVVESCPGLDFCYTCDPGTWWVWVGPDAWDPNYACGSLYVMTISGYTGGSTPAASTTWGRMKGMFR